jgi:hypothetical protein
MSQDIQQFGRVWKSIIDISVRLLVRDAKSYRQLWPNDIESLRALLRPGDVILVEGNQRVSQIIKYLTQSSWSHAALYVGDALLKREGSEKVREKYGEDAGSLLIEANMESGVCPTPLSKYRDFNIRICRPIKLRREDLDKVVDSVLDEIGRPYNVRHIIGLMRYYFPFSVMPRRWQMTAPHDEARSSRNLICSAQIAMAFQRVRYPIQPVMLVDESLPSPRPSLARRLMRRKPGIFETRVFSPCDPLLVTPRDFDLSPYFEIVKHSVAGTGDFDYKRMRWSDTGPQAVGATVANAANAGPAPLVAAGDLGAPVGAPAAARERA